MNNSTLEWGLQTLDENFHFWWEEKMTFKEAAQRARLIAVAPEMEKALRGARLMLYAWKGSGPEKWGPHHEIERTIKEIEDILSKVDNR